MTPLWKYPAAMWPDWLKQSGHHWQWCWECFRTVDVIGQKVVLWHRIPRIESIGPKSGKRGC